MPRCRHERRADDDHPGDRPRPSRIRDLWSGRLAGLGHCPTCERLLDEPHLETCRWPGLVGSNAEEHWL